MTEHGLLPPPTPAPAEAPWQRLNVRMLLVHVVTDLLRAVPALVGVLLAGGSSGQGPIWGLIVAGIAVLAAVARWTTTRYRVGATQVQLRAGLLRRRQLSAPLDRVRTVDVQATLMHRLVGLRRVKLGTGRSDTQKERGLTLDGLGPAEADRLRAQVLHRQQAAPADQPEAAAVMPTAPAAPQPVELELARLDPSWIRYGPFTLTGLVTVAALVGIVWRVINEAHIDPNRYAVVRGVRDRVEHTTPVVLAIAAAAGLLVAVAVLSTVGYVLAFWGFRLTRTASGTVHVSRGLLTTRATTIEDRRLRGVEVSEPLLLRAVGGARLIAVATGLRVGRGAERGGGVLLPPAPRATAVGVAAAVSRTTAPFEAKLPAHPPAARRRRFSRAALVVALLLIGAALAVYGGAPVWLFAVPAVAAVLLTPIAADRYRSLGHALADAHVVVAEGSLVRRRVALAGDAVIGWNLRTSFFQRRAGVCTLSVTTACGRQAYRALDMASAEAVGFADTVTPGLLTPFLAAEN